MSRRWPILAIFILSGAAGLIYEVVWARQLVLVFGNTTQAVSAILTGFFGGIAIGSVVGGRIADRVRRPLRMYGLLELILVVVVILTPVTFRLLGNVYAGAFGTLEDNPTALALVRFGLSLLALGPATILMGATLPTLTRHLSRDPANLSSSFGRLYAANTFGAILGTIAAGFILIELLGLTGTLLVGAACSAIAGIAALILDARRGPLPDAATTAAVTAAEAPAPPEAPVASPLVADQSPATAVLRPRLRLALLVAYVSGFSSLAYQVLWVRLLASGTGDSTYVFTTILTIFLIGLALGAVAFNLLRTRIKTINLLATGQIVIAVLVTIGMVFYIGRGGVAGVLPLTTSFKQLFTHFALPVAFVVLPATFVMGLTFPATSALIADPKGHVGGNSGLLLSANTLGAISGTFLIPFVVIPLVGSPVALGLIAILNASVGTALALRGRIEMPALRSITGAVGIVTAVVLVVALAAGTVFVDPNIARVEAAGGTIQMHAEDDIASVQAGTAQGGSSERLWVTGTSMTALTVDVKLMPVLPLILQPHATTDLTVAFGMGSAWRGALIAGLSATAVELVPSVPDMFGVFYADAPTYLADPKGRIIVADGRNHVELTSDHYDIIVVDPPPPIETAGVSVISSLEFYQAAKARLNPGGVMMQWIPYGQTIDEFKAHVRTYAAVFPHVIIAFGPGGAGTYMLGSNDPISFTPEAIQSVLSRPGVVQDISSTANAPQHDLAGWAALIPQLVWIQGDQVTKFAGDGPMVTDDHPLPEYFLLRHLFGPPSPRVTPKLLLSLTPAP